ncbi:hypothetical protein Tco_0879530 [Tanacetum coccineum]
MKDLRQRVERRQNRNPLVQKVINMVNVHSSKRKKRKDCEATESWMNTPISFPPIMMDDASDEPLIIKAEVEGYLVKRVYVDEGSSVGSSCSKLLREHSGEKVKADSCETDRIWWVLQGRNSYFDCSNNHNCGMPEKRREADDKGRNAPRRGGRGCKEQLENASGKATWRCSDWEPADMTGVLERWDHTEAAERFSPDEETIFVLPSLSPPFSWVLIARMMNVLRIEIKYLKARKYISEFKTFSIENIPRGNNQKADVLSKLATVPFHHLTKEILVEVLNERSTKLPSDNNEARALRTTSGNNYVIRGNSHGSLRKAHETRLLLAHHAVDAKTEVDSGHHVRFTPDYQGTSENIHDFHHGPVAFYQWGKGLYLVCYSGQRKELCCSYGIDYFTKWVEAKAWSKITRARRYICFVLDKIHMQIMVSQESSSEHMGNNWLGRVCVIEGMRQGEWEDQGKLGTKWDGPYRVTEAFEETALTNLDKPSGVGRMDYLLLGRIGEEEQDTSLGAPGRSDEEDRKSFLRKDRCPTISTHMANSLGVIALHSAWHSVVQLTLVVEG